MKNGLIATICASGAAAIFIGGGIMVGFFGYLAYIFLSSIFNM